LAFQFAHDLRNRLFYALGINGPFSQGDLHRSHQLVTVERNPAPIALDDRQFTQLNAFKGREAETTCEADATTADHPAIFGRPRILHLGIKTCATRATHSAPDPQSG